MNIAILIAILSDKSDKIIKKRKRVLQYVFGYVIILELTLVIAQVAGKNAEECLKHECH